MWVGLPYAMRWRNWSVPVACGRSRDWVRFAWRCPGWKTRKTSMYCSIPVIVSLPLIFFLRHEFFQACFFLIRTNHPTNPLCSDLLHKTDRDLRAVIADKAIECSDRSVNAVMRSSIWAHYSDNLELGPVEIDITKGDAKSIWGKINAILPVFSLFQSDRKNSDSDNEIQDPSHSGKLKGQSVFIQ